MIDDSEHSLIVHSLDTHRNWATVGTVLHCVLEQILEHLLQPDFVPADGQRAFRTCQLQGVTLKRWLDLFGHTSDHLTKVDWLLIQREVAGFDTRNIKQRRDQTPKTIGLIVYDVQSMQIAHP